MRRWEAWINHAGWALVAASGIAYGVFKYFLPSADADSRISNPWQPAMLAVHLVVGPLAVFGLGLVFRRHALARWQAGEREGRRTGAILLSVGLALPLSGYLVQALTGEAARRWVGWGHAAAGVLVAAAYALHPRRSKSSDDALENGSPNPNPNPR